MFLLKIPFCHGKQQVWEHTCHLSTIFVSASRLCRGLRVETDTVCWRLDLNSVVRDDKQNYLVRQITGTASLCIQRVKQISSRHLHALLYISGTTGETIWSLGGKHNSFQGLDGSAVFTWVGICILAVLIGADTSAAARWCVC